jgi:murein DD-endopeptidase / murein LD-carboxypeptidase
MKNYFLTLVALVWLAVAFCCSARPRAYSPGRPHSLFYNGITGDSILQFAQSLIGIRYREAASDPKHGFDCSGFVSYVFKNFNFVVPRTAREFFYIGEKIRFEDARPGDIILFTGTKKRSRKVGHMGIVYCNDGGEFKFIHSTSGKEHGVTITTMNESYRHRFVQIIRLLKTNDDIQPVLEVNLATPISAGN